MKHLARLRPFLLLPWLAACAAPTVPAQSTVKADPPAITEVAARSSALADRFQSDLQTQLRAALATAGPAGAIDVCQSVAPAIAASLSEESGADVRRLALKARNPAARAEGDMEKALQELAAAPLDAQGRPAVKTWTSGNRIHWVRAIPMQAQPCNVCHGTNIAPDVAASIAAAYPDDRATGFIPGDLRGAFAVSWPAS